MMITAFKPALLAQPISEGSIISIGWPTSGRRLDWALRAHRLTDHLVGEGEWHGPPLRR